MSIHYKFKTSKDFDSIAFGGPNLSVTELKNKIFEQKKINSGTNDLHLSNAQTLEEYTADQLIPKNTSVIVRLIPGVHRVPEQLPQIITPAAKPTETSHLTENEKLAAMIEKPEFVRDKTRRPNYNSPWAVPPPDYRCHRCGQPGHYIQACPTNGDDTFTSARLKKATGIPRSFLKEISEPVEKGAMTLPSGGFAVNMPNELAFNQAIRAAADDNADVPERLRCQICKKMLRDAVKTPCCGAICCDECECSVPDFVGIRTALLSTAPKLICPLCNKDKVRADRLIIESEIRAEVGQLIFKRSRGLTGTIFRTTPTAASTRRRLSARRNKISEYCERPRGSQLSLHAVTYSPDTPPLPKQREGRSRSRSPRREDRGNRDDRRDRGRPNNGDRDRARQDRERERDRERDGRSGRDRDFGRDFRGQPDRRREWSPGRDRRGRNDR